MNFNLFENVAFCSIQPPGWICLDIDNMSRFNYDSTKFGQQHLGVQNRLSLNC